MNMKLGFGIAGVWLLGAVPVCAQSKDTSPHTQVYEKVRPSVVGIRAAKVLGEQSGTGVVLDREGFILTSAAVVPRRPKYVKVWLADAKFRMAEVVGTSHNDEVTLLKIDPKGLDLKPIEWGESAAVQIGQTAYTIGNAFNSIIMDDQPSFSAGVVSGLYRLKELRGDATYLGPAIETTAAVNINMEGAPLVDARGRMIGLITPNFSTQRWLGGAIPADLLKDVVKKLKEQKGPDESVPEMTGEGYLGVQVAEEKGRLRIRSVDEGSPAWNAGLREGDVIVEFGRDRVSTAKEFSEKLNVLPGGSIVWLKVDAGGEGSVQEIKITLTAKTAPKE